MIRLPDVVLPEATQKQLASYQAEVDAAGDYEAKVAKGKRLFSLRNRPDNMTFHSVKEALKKQCSGARLCGYCETSVADEVEHIKPKDLYPEFVFVWENYLYACGPCNGPKNNRFAVFALADGQLKIVTRSPKAPIVPPEEGETVLINPRMENPLDYMRLDLEGAFTFKPIGQEGSRRYQRARYTIDVLQLNERDELIDARKEAYETYCDRLAVYIQRRDEGAPLQKLNRRIYALGKMGHPTVWREMQRQYLFIDELRELFADAPEALDW